MESKEEDYSEEIKEDYDEISDTENNIEENSRLEEIRYEIQNIKNVSNKATYLNILINERTNIIKNKKFKRVKKPKIIAYNYLEDERICDQQIDDLVLVWMF